LVTLSATEETFVPQAVSGTFLKSNERIWFCMYAVIQNKCPNLIVKNSK
jgi:hypothetical protein